MNEPIFGDPSRVRLENRRSIFKGISLGCGGCSLIIAFGVIVIFAIIALVFWLLFNDEATQIALQQVRSSSAVKQALGEPIERSWFSTGQSKSINGHSQVWLDFSIFGPQDKALLSLKAEKKENQDWVFHKLTVTPEKSGQSIQLVTPQNEDSAKK
jgi:hypothetical protein